MVRRGAAWLAELHPAWVGLFAFVLYSPTIAYGYVGYDAVVREQGLNN